MCYGRTKLRWDKSGVGKVFDAIGFDQIKDKLFKSLVLYRLVYPKSKVKTAEYFYRYEQKTKTKEHQHGRRPINADRSVMHRVTHELHQ